MIDLDDLFDVEDEEKPIEPDRIFSSLVKDDEYEYLRDVQTEILTEWFQRRNEKDLILKMNTGAGKTFVGLIILQSCLNEEKGPAVYVCPDNQLVNQVLEKSKEYGIKCVTFSDSRPGSFPNEFLNNEAILVTVFDKVFNGRSIFKKYDIDIGAIILDDAHACITKAREKFTINIKSTSSLYEKLYGLFQDSLHHQDIGSARSIYNGDRYTVMQVPFWTWIDNVTNVASILSEVSQHYTDKDFQKDEVSKNIYFNWPLLQNSLESCHVFISGDCIEITPHCLPINQFTYFGNAHRRIFMSATLLDDSSLIKELDISKNSIEKPLVNSKYYNIGERMILIPSLINESLDRAKIASICCELSKNKNIIVLTPSSYEGYIKEWTDEGAKLLTSDNISNKIKELDKKNNYFILANRYDGIDLRGEQCRVLVMDKLPMGATLYERFIKETRPGSNIMKTLLSQKIEQGIGRSTRSSSDYSVVMLTGIDLETFILRNENKKYLSPQTRQQIDIGIKFSKKLKNIAETDAEEALLSIMKASFDRNSKWIKFHNTELQKSKTEQLNAIPIEIAISERKAYDLYNSNRSYEASKVLEDSINHLADKLEKEDKGWYLQLAAFYLYKSDKQSSLLKQMKAHEYNTNVSKSIDGIKYRKIDKNMGLQANKVYKNIKEFSEANTVVIYLNGLIDKLKFGIDSNTFEQAVKELGEFIGYNCQRPEKEFKNGLPDVLWQMTNNEYLVIEAKSEVKEQRDLIYKSEAEQITNSYNWFLSEYKGKKGYPILVHPSFKKDECAYPDENVRVITENELCKLRDNLLHFSRVIASNFNKPITVEMIGEQLTLFKLTPELFLTCYTRKIQ